jgi:esterase/lipase superfamily enzyme
MRVRILKMLLMVVVLGAAASCSRPPDLIGIDNPEQPVASVTGATKRKIFLITTREATEVAGVFYSDQRAPDLGYASVVVSIPPNHVPGELERAKRMPPNPETEFAVIDPTVYENDDTFVARVNAELARLPPEDRDVLFFIHGYNNTVSDSILRIAQFSEDTGFNGVSVLFSWASAGKATRYVYDLNSALVARTKLDRASSRIPWGPSC